MADFQPCKKEACYFYLQTEPEEPMCLFFRTWINSLHQNTQISQLTLQLITFSQLGSSGSLLPPQGDPSIVRDLEETIESLYAQVNQLRQQVKFLK